jgi:hypothetical protein
LSTSWEQAVRTHPVDKLLEQHCYKSAAGLLQLARSYVYTTHLVGQFFFNIQDGAVDNQFVVHTIISDKSCLGRHCGGHKYSDGCQNTKISSDCALIDNTAVRDNLEKHMSHEEKNII